MIMSTNKLTNMSIEFCTVLLNKAICLIESKYMIHIKTGIRFVIKAISLYSADIIAIKGANVHTKVDLQREERLKKYNNFCDCISQIHFSSRLNKIKNKYENAEVGKLCGQLSQDCQFLLTRCNIISS